MTSPGDFDSQRMPKKPTYAWLWIVGGILAVCGCGGIVGLGAILFPVVLQARNAAVRTRCISNMKAISSADLQYSVDNDGRLPDSDRWIDQTIKYAPNERIFTCPVVRRSMSSYGYAQNEAVGAKKVDSVADPTSQVLSYETRTLTRNAAGNPDKDPSPNRHGQGRSQSMVDGHTFFAGSGGTQR